MLFENDYYCYTCDTMLEPEYDREWCMSHWYCPGCSRMYTIKITVKSSHCPFGGDSLPVYEIDQEMIGYGGEI